MATATTRKRTARKATKRPHFAIRAIRNANPRGFRAHGAGHMLSKIFSL